jgi:hypothetical protein
MHVNVRCVLSAADSMAGTGLLEWLVAAVSEREKLQQFMRCRWMGWTVVHYRCI